MEIVLANAQQPQRPQLTPNVASDTDPVADTSSRKEIPAPPHEVKHTSPAEERAAFKQRTIALSNVPVEEYTKSSKDVQLDYDWYAAHGYREGCQRPVSERLVGLIFPPLAPSDMRFGNEDFFDPAKHPKDRVADMPTFTSFNDDKLHEKLLQAQEALAQRQGLRIYCANREDSLYASSTSTSLVKDTSTMANAFISAPLITIGTQGRLETFIANVARWDRRMGRILRDELTQLIPDRAVDGPIHYTFLIRELLTFAEQEWTEFSSALKAGPHIDEPATSLIAANSLSHSDPDQAYHSDGEPAKCLWYGSKRLMEMDRKRWEQLATRRS
ncbi:MAG: hypothetical protein SEPTF4163_002699 [Sporothrix epigloea]